MGKKPQHLGSKRKRLDGAGLPLTDELVKWVLEKRSNMFRFSRKMIMAKAKYLYDEKQSEPSEKECFVATNGWVSKFLKRNGLSLRRRTTTAKKDPSHVIDLLMMYILNV